MKRNFNLRQIAFAVAVIASLAVIGYFYLSPMAGDDGIRIVKSEITSSARFYPYQLDGVKMEVLAVKASDGTVRTAFNTCQVCYSSGRGYYVQSGQYLVCQNCGNRFHVNQVEVVRGGCNPIPIGEEDKQDDGGYIVITKDFMAGAKDYFNNWKKA